MHFFPPESDAVIRVSAISRRFGATTALDSVDLSLPRGAVYGRVGANGAGKTTLIKHILGRLNAERGSVRVFGLDPVANPVGVLSRIGHLSEENDFPGWMRVDELMRYSDEPSSGLDPIVRRDMLGAVIRTIASEGRTVLFSSHLLEEVEQVADHVTMINHGKILLSAPLPDIKESHRVGERLPSLDEIFVSHAGATAAPAGDR